MIRTHTCRCRVTRAVSKIGERHESAFRSALGSDGARFVGARKRFQMASQRGHVASLHGERRRKLVLQSEVAAHRIGCLIIKLNPAQRQAVGGDVKRGQRVARKPSLKDGRPTNRGSRRAVRKGSASTNGGKIVGGTVGEIELEGIVFPKVW